MPESMPKSIQREASTFAIQASALGHRFPGHRLNDPFIFQNVKLDVSQGESIVLLGPSGAGKSVLLKILCGLLEPTEGSITKSTLNSGMLFQKNALFDSMTVLENLIFPQLERELTTEAEARNNALSLLEAIGLSSSLDLYPDELSGGMQKRLGIARTLSVNPDLIFYDEPTAGLDPITSRQIIDLILRFKRERQSTIITIVSELERAYQLADTLYLLAKGQLILGGNPAEFKNSSHPWIQQFSNGRSSGPLTPQEELST